MRNPAQTLLARCDVGFYLWQKLALTALGVAYILSPLDVVPDVLIILGWSDDVFVGYLIARIWRSPTLPKTDGDNPELATAPIRRSSPRQQTRVAMVRREHTGGVR